MKLTFLIILTFSMSISTLALLDAETFFNMFEPKYIAIQKESCEVSIKEELSYSTDATGNPIRSGFLKTEVFNANFLSLRDDGKKISYHYSVRVEGDWSFALIEDGFSGGRYFKKMDIVDIYRVKDLGVDGWDSTFYTSSIGQIGARQHIKFRGEAYCYFYSKESKSPHLVSVGTEE